MLAIKVDFNKEVRDLVDLKILLRLCLEEVVVKVVIFSLTLEDSNKVKVIMVTNNKNQNLNQKRLIYNNVRITLKLIISN